MQSRDVQFLRKVQITWAVCDVYCTIAPQLLNLQRKCKGVSGLPGMRMKRQRSSRYSCLDLRGDSRRYGENRLASPTCYSPRRIDTAFQTKSKFGIEGTEVRGNAVRNKGLALHGKSNNTWHIVTVVAFVDATQARFRVCWYADSLGIGGADESSSNDRPHQGKFTWQHPDWCI